MEAQWKERWRERIWESGFNGHRGCVVLLGCVLH